MKDEELITLAPENTMECDDEEEQEEFPVRLGLCEPCGLNPAKYTCPKCQMKTCSLPCVNRHKESQGCDGIRDKTAYIPLSGFTELDLLSDYRLLEEAGRSVDAYHRDVAKRQTRQNKELPVHLHRLRCAAAQRGTQLKFLPPNFSRHKANTTYLDWKAKTIEWRLEWRLEDLKVVQERVPESSMLLSALQGAMEGKTVAQEGLGIFLAAEHTPGQNGRYHKMEPDKTLAENLKGVVVVEHPVFHLVKPEDFDRYPLVNSSQPLKARSKEADADGPSDPKKSKMTFYDVSDGEISDDSG